MDQYYHLVYSLHKEDGNNSINSIVLQTQNYNQSPIRVTKIASLITQNFSNSWWSYQWEERFCPYQNSSIPYDWCSPYYGTLLYIIYDEKFDYPYRLNKLGNVTLYITNDLSINPEWIAYQKGGNCQAISVLFNETVNRSGFVSRTVRSNEYDHMWNEIQINGSWKVFDIQEFGYNNGSNVTDSPYWNADPKEYSKFKGKTNFSVYALNLTNINNGFGKDITLLYIWNLNA